MGGPGNYDRADFRATSRAMQNDFVDLKAKTPRCESRQQERDNRNQDDRRSGGRGQIAKPVEDFHSPFAFWAGLLFLIGWDCACGSRGQRRQGGLRRRRFASKFGRIRAVSGPNLGPFNSPDQLAAHRRFRLYLSFGLQY